LVPILEPIAKASSGITDLWAENAAVPVGEIVEKILGHRVKFQGSSKVTEWFGCMNSLLREKVVGLVLIIQDFLIDVLSQFGFMALSHE
jgi:hypothetical protein